MKNSDLEHWDLDNPAFTAQCAVKDIYIPKSLTQQLDRLVQFCYSNQSLSLILGDSGIGKTTILRWLTSQLPFDTHEILTISLLKSESENDWLIPRIARFMGSGDSTNWHESINLVTTKFDELKNENRKLIVIIDEAHLLTTDLTLSELNGLLNLQSISGDLLSFILIGTPLLQNIIESNPKLSLNLANKTTLHQYTPEDAEEYLNSKIKRANLPDVFPKEIIRIITTACNGNPGKIDILSENCLIEAAIENLNIVNKYVVDKCISNLEIKQTQTAKIATMVTAVGSMKTEHNIPKPPVEKFKNPTAENSPPKKEQSSEPEISMNSLFKSDLPSGKPNTIDKEQDR